MKCNVCHEEFNPAELDAVAEHEHSGAQVSTGIMGRFVAQTFTPEQSGNVSEIVLRREDLSVDITYRNGRKYRWLDVPVEVMETAENCPSIGAWLNRTLKGQYRYYHLNGD